MKTVNARRQAVQGWLAGEGDRKVGHERRVAAQVILAHDESEMVADLKEEEREAYNWVNWSALPLGNLAEELADLYGAEDRFDFARLKREVSRQAYQAGKKKEEAVFVVHGIGVDSTSWVEGVYRTYALACRALVKAAAELSDSPVDQKPTDAITYRKDGDDCELWVTESTVKRRLS